MKVDLFLWGGEDLTFEDNSCVLILGLGKDIQITDYRLQFLWGGEDLTFEDNSCVLILGLGKDIQITDYRLQITVYLGSYVCFKQKDKVYNFIIYIIYIIYIIIFLFPDKVVLMRKL